MITVKKENKVYRISEDMKQDYLKKGYVVIDEKGNVLEPKEKSNKDLTELKSQIKKLNEQVNTLTTEKEELAKERDSLNEQVNTLTTEKEELAKERDSLNEQVNTLTTEKDKIQSQLNELTSSAKPKKEE